MRKLLILAALLIAGCVDQERWCYIDDHAKAQVVFDRCMAALPKGPTSTVGSNDWDEVVIECRKTASTFTQKTLLLTGSQCRDLQWQAAYPKEVK